MVVRIDGPVHLSEEILLVCTLMVLYNLQKCNKFQIQFTFALTLFHKQKSAADDIENILAKKYEKSL